MTNLTTPRPWQLRQHLTPAQAALWHHRDLELRAESRQWLRRRAVELACEHGSREVLLFADDELVFCYLVWGEWV